MDEKKIEVQRILDEFQQIQGALRQIQTNIDKKQNQYFSGYWPQGNYLLGWHSHRHQQLAQSKLKIEVNPKDKKFSLSSIFSRASLQLGSLESRKLTVFQKPRFAKKKKAKKVKVKGKCKRRRLRRAKKC